jgi:hypothetical protein
MNLSRRALLGTSGLSALAACTTSTTSPTVSQIASDVNLIATGMTSVVTALQDVPNIPAATLKQLQSYVVALQQAASTVATSTATPATSAVQEIVTVVEDIAPIALSFVPGGGAIAAIVQAAISLLPVVTAAVGIAGAPVKAPVYTPDNARLVLRAAPALAAGKP